MQDLWISRVTWDEPIPPDMMERWTDIQESWAALTSLTIDRWLGCTQESRTEIHGFSDASKRAYSAAVYARTYTDTGPCRVSLLMAKTKVAPVKTITLPNLELCGAALLVRVLKHLQQLNFLQNSPIYAWSDSQVVLTWLKAHPSSWKTFVANRVAFVQTELPSASWHYVPTDENPADLATRGSHSAVLKTSQLWWHGPSWLFEQPGPWSPSATASTVHESSAQAFVAMRLEEVNPGESAREDYIAKFSSLTRLARVTAWILRFRTNCQRKTRGEAWTQSFLSADELSRARKVILKIEQEQSFRPDLVCFRNGRRLPSTSSLKRLNPFIDEDGVLRVGGRLRHSHLTFTSKHPPILPKGSPLAQLYLKEAHLIAVHGGPSLTLSVLRNHVWIIGGTGMVKLYVRKCVKCCRARPILGHQLIGNLPAERVLAPQRAFTTAGLDYAGPIKLRTTKGRGQRSYKGYIALFVCFASKAVHLEAVSDLTTASFLAAYRRFVGRRGVCQTIYSDCRTNFQGAAKELASMFRSASEFYHEVAGILANQGTTWSFIPPSTPYFGGLWEAGVRSVKHHLVRVIGDYTLTFKELATVLIEIEACLNSRPLIPLSDDPEDRHALTPAHLLYGAALTLLPEAGPPDVPDNRLTRCQLLQRIRNHYWKRWSQEYLHHLQERTKWRDRSANFAVGQLVIIKDDRYPPTKWHLGRITETHPGDDGLVRVVTIRTATTTLKRPITRVSALPVNDDDQRRIQP